MLNGISPLISPDLLKVLAEAGHGDKIVFADAHFPGKSIAQRAGIPYLRLDGQSMMPLLRAVLELYPLDKHVDTPVLLMEKSPQDAALDIPIIREYEELVSTIDDRGASAMGYLERQDFYDTAHKATCIVQTGETAVYANLMVVKGITKV